MRTSCFLSARLRAPTSTLFPYTTLFRSKPDARPLLETLERVGGGRMAFVGDSIIDAETAQAAGIPFIADEGHPDRKSTRLNSSHITISYAVFCLKKKTSSCLGFS